MGVNTKQNIVAYIQEQGQARAKDLYSSFGLSRTVIHRHLKKLVDEGVITRVGKPPSVFYRIQADNRINQIQKTQFLPIATQKVINENFLSITPDGKLLFGVEGFIYWFHHFRKHVSYQEEARNYIHTLLSQREIFDPKGWLDITSKLTDTFSDSDISRLLVMDVYSYKIFGRTKLAKLVMYAKQIGDTTLINEVSDMARPLIENIINEFSIEAVVFVPPTVPRPIQFIDIMKYRLKLTIPEIPLVKVIPGDIPIPQKTLSTLSERVINTDNSVFMKSNTPIPYKNILLIDDVVGSGASFHEIAGKLKYNNPNIKSIYAFALVGNIKGYDVVREI